MELNNNLTADKLKELIKDSDEWLVGTLMSVYSMQTSGERDGKYITERNGIGFSECDASYMSSIAEYYIKYGTLTSNQLFYTRRSILKYAAQALSIGVEPRPLKNKKEVSKNKKDFIQTEEYKKAHLDKDRIIIEFKFPKTNNNGFVDTLSHVKNELIGREYIEKYRHWEAPLDLSNVQKLKDWGFILSDELNTFLNNKTEKIEEAYKLDLSNLGVTLYKFQETALKYIESKDGKALLSLEQGLGKTIIALAYLCLHPELRPVVIVCPAVVKLNWMRETVRCLTKERNVFIVSGRKKSTLTRKGIIIINYDILQNHLDSFFMINPKVLISDEIHYVKNPTTKRSKALRQLGKMCDHIIGLSGTPIENRPKEFFPALNLLAPTLFNNYNRFAWEYCGGNNNNGAKNTEKLNKILKETIMIRMLKEDVLLDLPKKIRSVIPMELENREEYNRAERDLIKWIKENKGDDKAIRAKNAEALVRIETLKQITVKGKIGSCIEWIQDYMKTTNKKLVVFCTHTEILKFIVNHFKGFCVKVDGRDNSQQKQYAVDQFQKNTKIKLFVGNIKAAGVGVTLTAASDTCFIELGWTPSVHDQAEDRTHRIGQLANSVTAYYLLANDTIEDKIADLIDRKRQIISAILDGKEITEDSLLTELMNSMLENEKYEEEVENENCL